MNVVKIGVIFRVEVIIYQRVDIKLVDEWGCRCQGEDDAMSQL
jgi:hypothetical protein